MTTQEYITWINQKLEFMKARIASINWTIVTGTFASEEKIAPLARQRDDLIEGVKFFEWMLEQEREEMRI